MMKEYLKRIEGQRQREREMSKDNREGERTREPGRMSVIELKRLMWRLCIIYKGKSVS